MKSQVKKNSKLFLTVAILDVTLQLAEKVFCMLQIILKGIFIGIMVSAPIGPIGILCAQRTLSRGKWHGLITGVGSAVSDFLYALLVLWSISHISILLERYQSETFLVGSIILIFFGLGVFVTHPAKNWSPQMETKDTRYALDFLSAFLLTLSNISIIFIFITLFASFNFIPQENQRWGTILLGCFSIFVGAMLWWYFLTSVISKTRRFFSRNGLVVMNRIIGGILMGFGIFGIIAEYLL